MLPPKENGTKAPLAEKVGEDQDGKPVYSWKRHQQTPADLAEIEAWYGPRTGVGWVCGAVSGGLEVLEFDDHETYLAYKAAAEALGLGELVERIESGYSSRSPSGGIHWPYFTDEVRGNTKLAQRPGPPDEKTGRPTVQTTLETRGEGGFIIEPPSNGRVHPSGGKYELIRGGVSTIATITGEERDALWALGRTFDAMPGDPEGPGKQMARRPDPGPSRNDGTRPGDDYNARANWTEILEGHGWRRCYTHGETTYWRRPGKSEGWSATTNVYGSGLLYVFSTSTPFEANRTYDKFGAYAVLEAGGNLVLAARTLADQGYGSGAKHSRSGRNGYAHQPRPGGSKPVDPPRIEVAEDPLPGPNEGIEDPHRLARVYLKERCYHEDGDTLVFHQGEFRSWQEGAYRAVLEKDIRADVASVAKEDFDRINVEELLRIGQSPKPEPLGAGPDKGKDKGPPRVAKVTSTLVNNVSLALSSYTLLKGNVEPPAWLCEKPPWPANEILPARNALIHLPSFVAGKPATIKPTPSFFCPYSIGYDFVPSFGQPSTWLDFLHGKLWPNDPQSVASLQEWFGYHLTPDTRQQKIGMLIGPLRCGKGTIARTLTTLIGALNVCNPTLSNLGTQFGSAVLIGKLAAIITDARLSGRSDIAQIVENLLAVSGEDGRTISRKHLPDWTGRLMTKFTIISNETPRFADTSGALPGRMLIWEMTESFYGREDITLFDRILPEMPGILLWAIQGWKRLNERGHFIQPDSGKALVEEMAELASPVGTFVKECCNVGPEHQVDTATIYDAWRAWCQRKGRQQPGEDNVFGRNLRTVDRRIERKQRRESGAVIPVYKGIDLKPPDFG